VVLKNNAKVRRILNHVLVYEVKENGTTQKIILFVEGKGLWSILYGFVAVNKDANTIEGLTFYQHLETPGLGGEVDNSIWKGLWSGRKIYDSSGKVVITVIKGRAGLSASAPHKVDGLFGAIMISRGVTNLMAFWLGETGFGPYLRNFKNGSL